MAEGVGWDFQCGRPASVAEGGSGVGLPVLDTGQRSRRGGQVWDFQCRRPASVHAEGVGMEVGLNLRGPFSSILRPVFLHFSPTFGSVSV